MSAPGSCGISKRLEDSGRIDALRDKVVRSSDDRPRDQDRPQKESVDEKYKTQFPIAWYGAAGWERELEKEGGEQAVGVRVIDGPDAEERPLTEEENSLRNEILEYQDRRQRERENNAQISSLDDYPSFARLFLGHKSARYISRNSLARLSVIAILVLLIICAVPEIVLATRVSWARFIYTGGLFAEPLFVFSQRHSPLRRALIGAESPVRLWKKYMRPEGGWAVIHAIIGVISILFVIIFRLQRSRAFLTIILVSMIGAIIIEHFVKKWNIVKKIRQGVATFRKKLTQGGSVSRSLLIFVPSPNFTAKLIHETLYFTTAVLFPWILVTLSYKYFPHTAFWACDGLSPETVMNVVMGSVLLSVLHIYVFHAFFSFSSDVRNQSGDDGAFSAENQGSSYNRILTNYFIIVITGFIILRFLYPECGKKDAMNLMERCYDNWM